MNLTIFDNYSDNSGEILNFKNIFKYLYELPDISSEILLNNIDNNSNIIDKIFNQCKALCEPVLKLNNPCQFFGIEGFAYPKAIKPVVPNWESALRDQCVISTLYTLLHHKLNNTQEKFSNYFYRCHAQGLGYFSLKDAGIIDDTNGPKAKRQPNVSNTDRAALSSKFIKTSALFFAKLYEDFNTLKDSPEYNILGNASNIPLFNSDLFYRIYTERKYYYKLRSMYQNESKKFSYVKYFDLLEHISTFEPGTDQKRNTDIVDDVLLQYKMERYYNLSLTECILKSIAEYSEKNQSFSLHTFPLEILLMIYQLPNVFSRNDFFKFALHSFDNEFLEKNYFFVRKETDSAPVIKLETTVHPLGKLTLWLDLFWKFTTFFSKVAFPICEKCFFLLLKDYFVSQYSNDFESKAISCLHDYIASADASHYFGLKKEIYKISTDDPLKTLHINTLAQELLLNQHCIFRDKSLKDSDYRQTVFSLGSKAHEDLINVIIDAVINDPN